MRARAGWALATALAIAACAGGSDPESNDPSPNGEGNADASVVAEAGSSSPSSDGSASNPSTDAPAQSPSDPFAPEPDTSEGLVNISSDLNAVLENGALAGACDAWQAAPTDRKKMLLCGKSMFFDEGFGTAGVPKAIVTFLVQNFPSEIGAGFEKLGMIPDPRSTEGLPLGMAPGAPLGGADTLAFTCASCHFAQLPDGRYAVGAPNHALEYGKLNLDIAVFPLVALGGSTSSHDPDAIKVVQPLLDEVNADATLKAKLLGALAGMIGAASKAPSFPAAAEHLYSTWKTGTMDFMIEPLPMNDHVHTISKISALWGIPSDAEIASSGMKGALLGHTGSTHALINFFEGFVQLGGGPVADWPASKLQAAVEYVESLRAPANPSPQSSADVTKGAALFASEGCIGCHDGPRGSGKDFYTFAAIGTDSELEKWADPGLSGTPCCSITLEPGDKLTHGIKSPRLVGTWAMTRFLHNGSVDTLDDVLCVNGKRGDVTAPAYGNGGHTFGCELGADDKRALLAYLKTR